MTGIGWLSLLDHFAWAGLQGSARGKPISARIDTTLAVVVEAFGSLARRGAPMEPSS
jgi:hypothetical protein